MIRTAVIGLGEVARIHIGAILESPEAELVAVCDIDEALKALVPKASFYTSYEEMLEKEKLDCVHICLPHYLHYPAAKAAITRGVNVFLEKPLALNTEEAEAIAALAEANKEVKVCLSLQNRYNETVEALRELIAAGKYGRLLGVKGIVAWFRPEEYYSLKPWRGSMKQAGGGVMINQGIHTLDLMQLIGGDIEYIKGSIDNLLDYSIEVEDTAAARLVFKSGATGLFLATVANADNCSVELEVTLEKARFLIKDSFLYKWEQQGQQEIITEDSRLPGTKFYYGAGHRKLINKLYGCISANSEDYVKAREGVRVIKIIDAIRKSSELKKAVKMEV